MTFSFLFSISFHVAHSPFNFFHLIPLNSSLSLLKSAQTRQGEKKADW